jgi:hypothetical protein
MERLLPPAAYCFRDMRDTPGHFPKCPASGEAIRGHSKAETDGVDRVAMASDRARCRSRAHQPSLPPHGSSPFGPPSSDVSRRFAADTSVLCQYPLSPHCRKIPKRCACHSVGKWQVNYHKRKVSEVNHGEDCNPSFRRKSQIFEEDSAFGDIKFYRCVVTSLRIGSPPLATGNTTRARLWSSTDEEIP